MRKSFSAEVLDLQNYKNLQHFGEEKGENKKLIAGLTAGLQKIIRIQSNGLTDRQRQIFLLFYSGKTVTEIAKTIGVNKSTVSRTLSRGEKRVKTLAEPLAVALIAALQAAEDEE